MCISRRKDSPTIASRRKSSPVSMLGRLLVVMPLALGVSEFPPLLAGQPEAQDTVTLLKALAEGYLSNRDSFSAFRCRFRIRVGKAPNFQEALKGSLSAPIVGNGLWVVNGGKVRFEMQCDPAGVKDAIDRGLRNAPAGAKLVTVTAPMPEVKFLDNGAEQLYYSPVGRFGRISDSGQRRDTVEWTPFDMAVMGPGEQTSPAWLIQFHLENKKFCSLEDPPANKPDSPRMIALGESSDKIQHRVFLDRAHGFLPARIWIYQAPGSTRRSCEVVITDFRACSGGRWFPWRSICILDPDNPNGPGDVREFTTLELDADTVPDDKAFAVQLPQGARLNDNVNPATQFSLKNAEVIGLHDLPRLVERGRSEAQAVSKESRNSNGSRKPETKTHSGSFGKRSLALWLGLALTVTFGLILIRRRFAGFSRILGRLRQ